MTRSLATVLTIVVSLLTAATGAAQVVNLPADGESDQGADVIADADKKDSDDPAESMFGADESETSLTQERQAEPSLETLEVQELVEAGFQFSDGASQFGSTDALLISLTAGTLVHGAGHLYMGDTSTAVNLMIMEGVGVFMSLLSAGVYAASDGGSLSISPAWNW